MTTLSLLLLLSLSGPVPADTGKAPKPTPAAPSKPPPATTKSRPQTAPPPAAPTLRRRKPELG